MKTIKLDARQKSEFEKTGRTMVDKILVYIGTDDNPRYIKQLKTKDFAGNYHLGKSYECRIK